MDSYIEYLREAICNPLMQTKHGNVKTSNCKLLSNWVLKWISQNHQMKCQKRLMLVDLFLLMNSKSCICSYYIHNVPITLKKLQLYLVNLSTFQVLKKHKNEIFCKKNVLSNYKATFFKAQYA